MKRSEHIITFLKRAKNFAQIEGITSTLKIDKDNTVEDVFLASETTGGLICDIDNAVGEIKDMLIEYYKKTNNDKLLKRLQAI